MLHFSSGRPGNEQHSTAQSQILVVMIDIVDFSPPIDGGNVVWVLETLAGDDGFYLLALIQVTNSLHS